MGARDPDDEPPRPPLNGVFWVEEGLAPRPWTGLGFGRFTGEVDKERFEDVAGVSESESSSDIVAFDLKFDDLDDLRRIGVFFFSDTSLVFDFAGVRTSSSSSDDSRTFACFFSLEFSGVLSLVGEEGRGDGGGGE